MSNTPRYALLLDTDYDGIEKNEPIPDPERGGLTKIPCADTVVAQGVGGDRVLDKILRECLQYEHGSTLFLGVSYNLLRTAVVQSKITRMFRIFVPGQVVIYVQPIHMPTIKPGGVQAVGDALEVQDRSVDSLYMRVRIFRFLTLPQDTDGNHDQNGKRKAKHAHVEYESDESEKGGRSSDNFSFAKSQEPKAKNTLRLRR